MRCGQRLYLLLCTGLVHISSTLGAPFFSTNGDRIRPMGRTTHGASPAASAAPVAVASVLPTPAVPAGTSAAAPAAAAAASATTATTNNSNNNKVI